MVVFPKSKEYCFVDAPREIRENIEMLNFKNILFDENCSLKLNQEKVCFSNELNCGVYVDISRNLVRKGSDVFYFTSYALMYGAIFSDYSIYECQVQRLMKKVGVLADLYRQKISFISKQGCSSDLGVDLITLANMANSISGSKDLKEVYDFSLLVNAKNENLDDCKLW
jgi:hypothetical protein